MLHRGFYRGTSELGRLLISPIPAISVPPLPLEETEIPITRQWFLRALVYFVGWLVFFALPSCSGFTYRTLPQLSSNIKGLADPPVAAAHRHPESADSDSLQKALKALLAGFTSEAPEIMP